MSLRVGAATADITPGVGVPMGGYGARQGVSTGVGDPLLVRAIVLDDETTRLAVAVCDLVAVSPAIVEGARTIIATECGIAPTNVVVAATHTHSGPELRREDRHGYAASTASKVAGAVRMALDSARPATLKLGESEVATISQNRRAPDGPIRAKAQVLLAEDADADASVPPIATVVGYACHATVLEHDNLEYSPDFPGATCRAVEAVVGGTAIYVQGAAGDVNPSWLRHDRAEVDRVGGVLGAAVARAALDLRAVGRVQRVVNLSWSEDLEVPSPPGSVVEPGPLVAESRTVELPRRALPPRDEIAKAIKTLELELEQITGEDHTLRRRLRPRLNQLRMEWVFAGIEGRRDGIESVEIQALRIAPNLALLALPGEFLVGVGSELEAASPFEHLVVAGYANGYVGYVPRAEDFPHGGYEVGCARLAPEAAGTIVATAADLLKALHA